MRALVYMYMRMAALAALAILDFTAELRGHRLHTVANAEPRPAKLKHRLRRARRLRAGDRCRPARQSNAALSEVADTPIAAVEAVNLSVNKLRAHAARNQLSIFRT